MRCKCTMYQLDEPTERSGIIHSVGFCGGTHAYQLHVRDTRIKELEAWIRETAECIKADPDDIAYLLDDCPVDLQSCKNGL